jgi:hypothetical protein
MYPDAAKAGLGALSAAAVSRRNAEERAAVAALSRQE